MTEHAKELVRIATRLDNTIGISERIESQISTLVAVTQDMTSAIGKLTEHSALRVEQFNVLTGEFRKHIEDEVSLKWRIVFSIIGGGGVVIIGLMSVLWFIIAPKLGIPVKG